MNSANPESRLFFVDWIRVIAFGLLIFFHCAMPFVPHNWEIKNKETSEALYTMVMWFHQWRLPLLFFISGAGVYFSLQKRTLPGFYLERFKRLFIPLIFAMFFTIPVQVYFEYLQRGRIEPGYLKFYPSVWEMIPYPDGSLTWSHLWFIVYLLAFLVVLIPFFAVTKINIIKKQLAKLGDCISRPVILILLCLPVYLIYQFYFIKYPEQGSLFDDSFVFNSSLTYLLLGYLLAGSESFWKNAAQYRQLWLTGAMLGAAVLITKYYSPVQLPTANNSYAQLYFVVNSLHIWCIILAFTGYAKTYLSKNSRLLVYLSKAILPFFIIHQTVIVALAYYLVQTDLPVFIKYLLLASLSAGMIFLIYDLIICRTKFTRFLFGMK